MRGSGTHTACGATPAAMPRCCHAALPPPLRLQRKKYKSLKVRTISTIAILATFFIFIYLGHVPCLLMLFTLQVGARTAAMQHA